MIRRFSVWWNTKLMKHFNPSLTLWFSSARKPLFTQYRADPNGHRYWDWWVFRLHSKPRKEEVMK